MLGQADAARAPPGWMATRDAAGALQVLQTALRLKPDHLGAHRMAISAALQARQPEAARQPMQSVPVVRIARAHLVDFRKSISQTGSV